MSATDPSAKKVDRCLSCDSPDLEQVLDLGLQPLANNLLRESDLKLPEPAFPLGVQVCRRCWMMQLTHLVPSVDLFSEYLYFSSFSNQMLEHARSAVDSYRTDFDLGASSFVVEVASNDGYLLKNFVAAGVPCLGVEPAENIAQVAREAGVDTLTEFFGRSTSAEIAAQYGEADLILGNNVFAHVPDTNDFVSGLAGLLKPDGRIVLEFPYAVDFLEHSEFDTIYHEHVFYFCLSALVPLFGRHGLEITGAERLSIHGGSLRITARHAGVAARSADVDDLLAAESAAGLLDLGVYRRFAEGAHGVRKELRALLSDLKSKGHRIAAYGASAKGSTLLNFCGIGSETLSFVADRSTHKQGLYTPGTHLPIRDADALLGEQPDYALLLTWNFAEEIMEQQECYLGSGGAFIVPIPKPEIRGRS